ncbi:MAG: o-succinylbenzoate synthase [Flavobacteriaceae bacterium]
MEACFRKYVLEFKRPSGTSRGILHSKDTYFIILKQGEKYGIGECGLLRGLSIDDVDNYEDKLLEICQHVNLGLQELLARSHGYPSIQFGLEQAFNSIDAEDPFILFPSDFTERERPIPINGLLWMGEESFLLEQLEEKIRAGFTCIKLKVGALDFDAEIRFLETLRRRYPAGNIEIRLDANGAFHPDEALDKLKLLARYQVHSIEQPIASGQWDIMSELCRKSPIDIALDEELIGISDINDKLKLLQIVMPRYIILKPSLIGGFAGSREWIELANKLKISWWITSALESNIGLNAIAQWTHTLGTDMFQGLGTGSLYINNFDSPLQIKQGMLYYNRKLKWPADLIKEICL